MDRKAHPCRLVTLVVSFAPVNFMGTVRVCKAFLPLLKQQACQNRYRRGRILNVTSMAGLVSPLPSLGAYGASKHAAQCWSESLRVELAPWTIQVATINPTFHKTPMASGHAHKLQQQWNLLSKEMKREYGQDYLRECQYRAEKTSTQFCWNMDVVINEILQCLLLEQLPMRVIVGMDGRLATVAMRMLPEWLVEFAVTKSQPRPVPAAMK
jgi:short-subunit dehydrogenase